MAQKLHLAFKLWPFWNAGTLALYRYAIWIQKVARDLIPNRNVSGICFSHIKASLLMYVWLPGELSKPFSRPKSFNTSNSQINFQTSSWTLFCLSGEVLSKETGQMAAKLKQSREPLAEVAAVSQLFPSPLSGPKNDTKMVSLRICT